MSALRIVVSVVVFAATFYFVSLLWMVLLPLNAAVSFIGLIPSVLCAFWASRYVSSRMRSGNSGWTSAVMSGAMIVGGIGFVLGFVGPIILAPDANQGPLLGIFITGPAGVVLGAIGGFIYWWTRGRGSAQREGV